MKYLNDKKSINIEFILNDFIKLLFFENLNLNILSLFL